MPSTTKIRKIPKKRKVWRGLFRLVLILTAVIILIHVAVDISLGILIQKQIDRFHLNHPGLYHIQFKSVRVNLFTGSVALKKFFLTPESRAHKSPPVNQDDSGLWEIEIPLLGLKGIKWLLFFFRHSLEVNRLELRNAGIKYFPPANNPQEKTRELKSLINGSGIPWPIRWIRAGSVDFQDCRFQVVRRPNPSDDQRNYEFDFTVYDSAIRCQVRGGSGSLPVLKSLEFKIRDLSITFPGRFYSLHIQEMGVSAPASRIWVHNLKLNPRYNKIDFSRKLGYRKSRIYFLARWLQFNHIKIDEALRMKGLESRIITIRGFRMNLFRDKRLPLARLTRPKKFPQEILREAGFPVRIEAAKLSRGRMVFEETDKNSGKSASIYFSDMGIDFFNITNVPEDLEVNPFLTVRGTALLMGKSRFTLEMSASVQDRNDRFTFSGSLDRTDVRELNPFLDHAGVHIESGVLNRLHYQAAANKYGAKGSMKVLYNGLRISLLKKKNRQKKEKIVTFLANLIIHTNNPSGRLPPRIGNMAFMRTVPRSLLNMMWKSFLNGIKSSIGLRKKKNSP